MITSARSERSDEESVKDVHEEQCSEHVGEGRKGLRAAGAKGEKRRRDHAETEAFGDAERKRNAEQRDDRGHRLGEVAQFDFGHGLKHEDAHDHEGRGGGRRRG